MMVATFLLEPIFESKAFITPFCFMVLNSMFIKLK